MISYSTNWMGPVSAHWTNKHGDHWCIGRIDIYNTGDDYPQEISLPMMHAEDWYTFTKWLHKYKTETVHTLEDLVKEYEKIHSKIRWFHNDVS